MTGVDFPVLSFHAFNYSLNKHHLVDLRPILIRFTLSFTDFFLNVKKAIRVSIDTDQEEVAGTLQELDLLAIPVVDKEERLVGIVRIDDAIDILEEEVTEDIYDQAGLADITGKESDRSVVLVNGSLWKIWKVRLPFLVIHPRCRVVCRCDNRRVRGSVGSIAVVAMFIPLIMDMGGNVGTQSSTVFARGVVLVHIQVKKFLKHFSKEIGIGFSMGVLIGTVAGSVVAVWQDMPLPGLAVGLALVVTMTLAVLLGFLVPYVLIKFKVDQAAGSAPIITSIKDIARLLIYFAFVSAFLGNIMG